MIPVTDHLDIWSAALTRKAATGRGRNSGKFHPHGIQKLRELILELAVRGRLVPQNPDDEPASVLLEKIAKEKARLVEEGKIKKQKTVQEILPDEVPFVLPDGWEWARFPEVCFYKPGKTPSTKNPQYWAGREGGVPWVSISDMEHFGHVQATEKRVTKEAANTVFKYDAVPAGSLIMSFKLTVGKISVLDIDAYHNEAIISIRPFTGISRDYLFKFLPTRALAGNTKRAIMGNTLNATSLSLLLIPVPPLPEQHRIVAKVDELMALCDRLEQAQTDSLQAHQTLVATLLRALTDPVRSGQTTFEQAWTRIARHFDTLFTTEESIDQLKQTLLQLAVMGKLVPQNPNDEPASVLLEKIAQEKARLVKEGKIKKQKKLPEIAEDEKRFKLPKGWEWARFAEYALDIGTGPFGSMVHQSDYVEDGVPLINPSHMIGDRIVPDYKVSVSRKMANKLETYALTNGDIVMARRGEVGRIALVRQQEAGWLCGTGSFVLRFSEHVFRDYLKLVFRCDFVRRYLVGEAVGTTMVNLNHGILKKMPFGVPPLAEQHRIVARVDELMTLCDALKARLREAEATRARLADAVVDRTVVQQE